MRDQVRHTAPAMLALSTGPLVLLLVMCDVVHSYVIRPAALSPREAAISFTLSLLLIGAAVVAVTLLEAVAVLGYSFVTARVRGRFAGWVAPTLVAAASAPLLMLLARQPFIGNRYKDSPVAVYGPWVVLVILTVVVVSSVWVGARLLSWFVSSPTLQRGRRRALGLMLVSAFIAIVVVDSLWYAGWYPVVHTVFSVASLVVAHVLLVIILYRRPAIRAYSGVVTGVVIVALVAALPVTGAWADQTTKWRVATGTLFASRVISPLLRVTTRPMALRDLDSLPKVDLRELLPAPAVTGTPPALASTGLLLTVDTLRFDVVGLTGTGRGLTPNIDGFFVDGHVFERAYSQYASTRNSVRAILESRFGYRPQQGTDDLINRLRDYGFQVIAVLPTDMTTFVNVERYNFSKVAFYEDPATIVSVLSTLTKDIPAEKRFVWVHLYQPHDPYEPRNEFRTGTSSKELYEGEVRWVDSDFAQIVSLLSTHSDIVVFGADHGEEFREHGGTLHGRTVYDETIRVPMAIKVAGGAAMRRRELVGNVDIAPTILAALGIPVPDAYEGYDLLGRASVVTPNRVLYSESVTNAVAVMRENSKWVHWTDFDLWEAYDLRNDPRELRNLADQPHTMAAGRALITSFEMPWYILPPLRKAGDIEYLAWLENIANRNGTSSNLERWAGFQLAAPHASQTRSRALLERALQEEREPLLMLALMDTLGPVPLRHRVAVPPRDAPYTGLLIEMLRYPEITTDPRGFIRSAMGHPVAAVRARAAERLAITEPSAAADALAAPQADSAVLRGLLAGLATRATEVSPSVFRPFVENQDVDVRVAVLKGIIAQGDAQAVPLLRERRGAEKSPSVVKVILAGLLALDRQRGIAALRDEIARPMLSDYIRAQLIADWNVTEAAEHLAELFIKNESGAFRNYLFAAASHLQAPQSVVSQVVEAMSTQSFEPALRAKINSYLRTVKSAAPDNQNDKPGVPRKK